MNRETWKDEFKGHIIERLTPSGESVATFDSMETEDFIALFELSTTL
jgi:hypothetical protein